MHHLQQHILSQLIRHDCQRYADLKPSDVEGNLFTYHLGVLTRAGFVEKSDNKYKLTSEGLRYADSLSLTDFAPRKQPRIVTLIVCCNEAGEYLLLKRARQPLLGQIGFPYGKIHLGETIAGAAQRELREKTGLTASLTHRGDGYVTIYEDGEPVSQIFFHLFVGRDPHGELKRSAAGDVFWSTIDRVKDHLMPSVPELIRLIGESDGRFFTELTYK